MFLEQERSAETVARYEIEASRFVGRYCREHHAEVCDAPYEARLRMAILWFLNSPGGVWSEAYIRLLANALSQRLEMFVLAGLIDDNPDPERSLLSRLKHSRPESIEKRKRAGKTTKKIAHQKKVAAKKSKRKKPRKSLPMRELRALIGCFRQKGDGFSRWLAGYIIFASRLGWRPGEILMLQRDGTFLSARAEKHTNGRGLTDVCRIDIGAYFEKSGLIESVCLASAVDRWIADTRKWEARYGGLTKLQDNINSRLVTACKACQIKRVCIYTFRHVAISCMKSSGFSPAEIAVIVNHATDRTAGEHYGKRRHGIRRAKKALGFDRARLLMVREKARSFDRSPQLSI
jgi:integrase